jgi:hypothetical protein
MIIWSVCLSICCGIFHPHALVVPSLQSHQYENFNETDAGKPAFLRVLPPLTLANSTYMNEYYRLRLRSLKAVDEMVDSLVAGVTIRWCSKIIVAHFVQTRYPAWCLLHDAVNVHLK